MVWNSTFEVILISSKGQRFAKELEKLQDQVSGFSFQQVQEIVEMELGKKLEDIFEGFNEKPLASASIGQVHQAVLRTGEPVAVKVQRPDIRSTVQTDLEILDDMTRIMEANLAWVKKPSLGVSCR